MARSEKRLLQIGVAIGCLVPIGAGLSGVLFGAGELGAHDLGPTDLDSHFRYLSGLLLAIGLGFVSTIPNIETKGPRFRLLTGLVLVGGIGRLIGFLALGIPSWAMVAALIMELGITPLLALWQFRVTRKFDTRHSR